jgi:hypothetical protein
MRDPHTVMIARAQSQGGPGIGVLGSGGLLPYHGEDSETSAALESPPDITEVWGWYEDGYSMAPDGCRVELPAESCGHPRRRGG